MMTEKRIKKFLENRIAFLEKLEDRYAIETDNKVSTHALLNSAKLREVKGIYDTIFNSDDKTIIEYD